MFFLLLWFSSAQAVELNTLPADLFYQHDNGLRLISAPIVLKRGDWHIASYDPFSAEPYLLPPSRQNKAQNWLEFKQKIKRNHRQRAQQMKDLYPFLAAYASSHQGLSPPDLDTLSDYFKLKKKYADLFLIPQQRMMKKIDQDWQAVPDQALIVETHPLIDDGRYWQLNTDGQIQRLPIDQYPKDLVLKPAQSIQDQWAAAQSNQVQYRIIARHGTVRIDLFESSQKQHQQIELKPSDSMQKDPQLLTDWLKKRVAHWRRWSDPLPPLLSAQVNILERQYGLSWQKKRRQRRQNPDLLSILSGQSALYESLQPQLLSAAKQPANIPIDTLLGVNIPPLNFQSRLAQYSKRTHLAIADRVPVDRLLIWLARPSLLDQLDWQAYPIFNRFKQRILNRLGLSFWSNRFNDQLFGSMVMVLPDLEWEDGTELSLILTIKNKTLLNRLGLPTGRIMPIAQSYWTVQDGYLWISTDRSELERLLDLKPKNSLGQSDEFQLALLEQNVHIPLDDRMEAWIYFSDPFIRHLVSPAHKIAQFRRQWAKQRLQNALAAEMLYRADQNQIPSLNELIEKNYLKPQSDLYRDNSGRWCNEWGCLGQLDSLISHPVIQVSMAEKEAYQNYRQRYHRLWRQFFDPISLRLDRTDSGHRLSIHIEPLIRHSIYHRLRQWIKDQPIAQPQLKPDPIAQLSLSLSPSLHALLGMSRAELNQIGLPSALFQQIEPELHIAIGDNEPILHIGGHLNWPIGRNLDSIWFLAGLLTQPTVILFKLKDESAAQAIFNQLRDREQPNIESSFKWQRWRKGWLLQWTLFDQLSLYFYLRIEKGYLMLSNQPFYLPHIVSIAPNSSQAALILNPGQVKQQKQSQWISNAIEIRKKTFRSMIQLEPFLSSGFAHTMAEAIEQAQKNGLFLYKLNQDEWRWNGRLSSYLFGSVSSPRLPDQNSDELALLKGIRHLKLRMNIEKNALKASLDWQ